MKTLRYRIGNAVKPGILDAEENICDASSLVSDWDSYNVTVEKLSEIKNTEDCYGLYPTVGENLDYLNLNNSKIDFLYRKLDKNSWQYCNKGFFNFKNFIPKIISSFS